MARSFSNAKRLSFFFSGQLFVNISRRGIALGTHGAPWMNTGSVTRVEESSKPISRVPQFESKHVNSFSAHTNVYKSQISSMLSFSSKFSTTASQVSNPVVSHARPLSPHLAIYKPNSSSMFSISSRIAASALSGFFLLFYMMCMKTGLICLTFNTFYQLLFGLNRFSLLICFSFTPLFAVHYLHVLKQVLRVSIMLTRDLSRELKDIGLRELFASLRRSRKISH